jgi:hypothetical protein
MDKVQKPSSNSVMHHHQNPLVSRLPEFLGEPFISVVTHNNVNSWNVVCEMCVAGRNLKSYIILFSHTFLKL